MIKLVRYFVLPVLVLAAALFIAVTVVRSRPRAVQEVPENLGTLVEVAAAHQAPRRIDVEAQGVVMPARRVIVQPQVSGRIVLVTPGLSPGTILRNGELLFAIEDADFDLAVERQRAALAEAEAQLELEQGRRKVAEKEWELFQDEVDAEQVKTSLALREPQLRASKAAVATAKARLEQAQLDLARTVVRSPFNAFVLEESIEVGQTVTPQSQAVTLVGTDEFWVRASLRTDQLNAIQVPGRDRNSEGSRARVRLDSSNDAVREGKVVRLLGDLDTAGRMARVLIEVSDPLALAAGGEAASGGMLLLDSYVDLLIEGAETETLFELPRGWLRDGKSLWIYADDRLEIRDVDIAWRFEDTVLIRAGLTEGELIVTSRIATPIGGMKLRHDSVPLEVRPNIELTELDTEEEPLLAAPEELLPEAGASTSAGDAERTATLQALDLSFRDDQVEIVIRADGNFPYSGFSLPDPPRYVLELDGVESISEQIAVQEGLVQQVRRAQYRTEPRPVARVVVDLDRAVKPTIEESTGIVRLLFASGEPEEGAPR